MLIKYHNNANTNIGLKNENLNIFERQLLCGVLRPTVFYMEEIVNAVFTTDKSIYKKHATVAKLNNIIKLWKSTLNSSH